MPSAGPRQVTRAYQPLHGTGFEMPIMSAPARRLRCDRCGWAIEVNPDDLRRLSHGDWLRCCMKAMTLDVGDRSVRLTDRTKLERSAGPDGAWAQ